MGARKQPWVNVNEGLKVAKQRHLFRIEAQDLQTLHRRRTRQSDITLALLKHATEIDFDALYGLALTLVDRKGPRKDERDLLWRNTRKRQKSYYR
jgi:hypothetical protein